MRISLIGGPVPRKGEQVRFVTRRSVILTVLALALIAMLAALTACGDDSSSGGGNQTYTDENYGYSFEFPESWKLEEGGNADVSAGGSSAASVGVYDPEGAVAEETYIDMMQVSVYELSVTVDDSIMPQIKGEVETVLESLESQAGDIETLAPLAEAEVGGMSGYSVTYSFAKNGAPVTSTLYFMFSGDIEYQLTVQAADENWEANRPVFDAILGSFEPGPAE
jgi:hypothetical protein